MALPIFLPCAAGVEELLADEVRAVLPDVPMRTERGGVMLEGGPDEVMALNLECRLPQRVLIEVADGPYRHEDDVYALGRRVDWTQWITPRHTLRVDATAQRSPLKSLNFAALRIKDAACDVMRDATGERPSVDTRRPDLSLVLHLGPERATLYVDSSGEPLFPVLGALAVLGSLASLRRRALLLPVWWMATLALDVRAGETYATIPLALLAGTGPTAR